MMENTDRGRLWQFHSLMIGILLIPHRRNKDRWSTAFSLLLLLSSVSSVSLTGCQGQRNSGHEVGSAPDHGSNVKSATAAYLRLDDESSLVFGTGDRIYIRGISFEREIEVPEPIFLDSEYEIEFFPLAHSDAHQNCSIETYIVEAGSQRLIGSSIPVFLEDPENKGETRLETLAKPVRLNLGSYSGRTVSLKWVQKHEGGGDHMAAIGIPKLRPVTTVAERPHILFICLDTLRYDRVFGEVGTSLMPRLKAFSDKGVVYTHAFSNASWTLPSITSVLTGLYPRFHRTGQLLERGKIENWKKGRKLPPGQFRMKWGSNYFVFGTYPKIISTLAEQLQKADYNTGIVASNHFYTDSGLAQDGTDIVYRTGIVRGTLVNRAAFDLLETFGRDRPLFLLVHYMDIHQYVREYKDRLPPGEDSDSRQSRISRYDIGVEEADRAIQELLDRWSSTMGFENSLIVVFSDHGEQLDESGRFGHGNSMRDVLLHVPLIIKYPEYLNLSPGRVDHAVTLVDLYPTILDLVSLREEEILLSGESLITLGESGHRKTERYIFADYQLYGAELSAARTGDFKVVFDFEKGTRKLVETKGQKEEAIDNTAIRRKIEKAFGEYIRQSGRLASGLVSEQIIDDEEMQRNLRALGYIN